MLTRRRFIQATLTSGTALLCRLGMAHARSAATPVAVRSPPSDPWLAAHGPIDRTLPDVAPRQFYGDDNRRPHRILWNLPSYLAQHPEPIEVEDAGLVIIGGGASGLFTAFGLRDQKPIVLEQASRFGGNAKGQTFRGVHFGLGSAYIELPTPGTPMDDLYKALRLDEIMVQRRAPDPVAMNGTFYRDFWSGGSDPEHVAAYTRMQRAFGELLAPGAAHPMPDIVPLNVSQREAVRYYDQWTMHGYLRHILGGDLPPQMETVVEHYCWSTYAGSSRELSAAAVLSALVKEASPTCAGAGGNAAVTERLVQRLHSALPADALRADAVVVRVRPDPSGVDILYVDARETLRKVRARAVVMACPKFVAMLLVEGLHPERVQAIRRLRYRAYMTAHVLIGKAMPRTMFDVYFGHTHKTDLDHLRAAQQAMQATDTILANWAQPDATCNVLSLYRAFAYEGARPELNTPDAYNTARQRFAAQVESEVLPLFGLKTSDVVDTRLALWGHALPLAAQGIYRDDTVDTLRTPHHDRVFFVEQDNWAYPALTTGATESVLQAKAIRASLARV